MLMRPRTFLLQASPEFKGIKTIRRVSCRCARRFKPALNPKGFQQGLRLDTGPKALTRAFFRGKGAGRRQRKKLTQIMLLPLCSLRWQLSIL